MRPLLLVLVVLAAGCGGGGAAVGDDASGPRALVESLRDGGRVVYLRHAFTDRTEIDIAGAPMHDCSRQRNLNDAGRAQARSIGEAIRALGIPTGEVVSSEYCRCVDTARLAFGRFSTERLLTGLPLEGEEDYDERVAALRTLLSEPPPRASNRVVVGHDRNLAAAAGVAVDEGEAAIFEPLGGGEFRLAGRIPAPVWPQLVDALGEES